MKIIREIEYEKANLHYANVLVRIMHARRESVKFGRFTPLVISRTEENNYGHREGKNRETTSGWIYIITRSGPLPRQGIRILPKGLSIARRPSPLLQNPPILFFLDRYREKFLSINRFNLGNRTIDNREDGKKIQRTEIRSANYFVVFQFHPRDAKEEISG